MRILVTILSLLVLAGCQQESNTYDIKNVGKKTYLINQMTGDLSVVEKGKVISLQTYKLPKNKKLSLYGNFNNKIQFNVATKFIIDRIYYRLNLEGFTSREMNDRGTYVNKTVEFDWFIKEILNNKFDTFTIQLSDSDGFLMGDKDVNLASGFIRTLGSDGKIQGLQYEGNFKVNPLQIAEVTALNYTYIMNSLKKAPK